MDTVVPQNAHINSRNARNHPNNSRGILQLPDELLVEISFQVKLLCTADIPPRTAVHPLLHTLTAPHVYRYKWVIVSHICYRWRQVVLAVPRLWSTIALPYNMSWIQTLLERSKRVPLTVIADTVWIHNREFPSEDLMIKAACDNGIRELQAILDPYDLYSIFAALTSDESSASSTALLESLDINICFDHDDFPTGPHPSLFIDTFSHLRHLTFRSSQSSDHMAWPVEWPNELTIAKQFICSSLTTLHLLHLQTPISVDTCLMILMVLPELEDLALGQVLVPSSEDDLPIPPLDANHMTPRLLRLRRISLEGSSEWVVLDPESFHGRLEDRWDCGVHAVDVLRHIIIPTSTEILYTGGSPFLFSPWFPLDFICGTLTGGWGEGEDVAILLGEIYSPIRHCHLTLSCIDMQTVEFVIELFCSTEDDIRDSESADTESGERNKTDQDRDNAIRKRLLRAQFRTGYRDFMESIRSALDSFGTTTLLTVRTLQVQGFIEYIRTEPDSDDEEYYISEEGGYDSDDVWAGFLDPVWKCVARTMPNIEKLAVFGHSAEFIKWLTWENSSPGVHSSTLLPCLHRLEVDGADPNWRNDLISRFSGSTNCHNRTLGPAKSFSRRISTALAAWNEQFGVESRALGCLVVHDAQAVDQKDLDRLRASSSILHVDALYTTTTIDH